MKKKLFLLSAVCLMTLSMSAQYVDLGLPSGTKWKTVNEPGGFYTFQEAVEKFGNNLPTREQFEELSYYCTWTWTEGGEEVKGPNGNSIFFPAEGFRSFSGGLFYVGDSGYYWSRTSITPGSAYKLVFSFNSGGGIFNYDDSAGHSIRLVR